MALVLPRDRRITADARVKPEPGTYALILRSRSSAGVRIGRWGRLDIEPGYYVYVGSAFGPGGVRARVLRHFRKSKAKHWHIDYLRERVEPICAWCSYVPSRLEHRWARAVAEMPGITSVRGFGCSDCGCHAHLFAMAVEPEFSRFRRTVGGAIEAWPAERLGGQVRP